MEFDENLYKMTVQEESISMLKTSLTKLLNKLFLRDKLLLEIERQKKYTEELRTVISNKETEIKKITHDYTIIYNNLDSLRANVEYFQYLAKLHDGDVNGIFQSIQISLTRILRSKVPVFFHSSSGAYAHNGIIPVRIGSGV